MKKLLAVILACLLLTGLVFGCAKSADNASSMEIGSAVADEMVKGEGAVQPDGEDVVLSDSATADSTVPNTAQKLVRKVWLEAEIETMDPLLEDIAKRIGDLEGYVEARNIYNGSQYGGKRYRSAELTVRIPADKLDQFVAQVSEKANIVSNKETTDDITLDYVDTESRANALRTEQTRLMELLAEAQNMSDLLQIEDRLTQVRGELEKMESQLRLYDNMVDYGTVYLTVNEVTEYTVTEEPDTVWERISTGFVQSLKDLGEFFVELFIVVVVGLPYIVILGIAVTVVVFLWRLRRKKRKAKKEEKAEE